MTIFDEFDRKTYMFAKLNMEI